MEYKLQNEIINLSVASDWMTAKEEWKFVTAYPSKNAKVCLCGHFPIKNICIIENVHNGKKTEVGNCCVINFLGIDDGKKIFESIKRLNNDIEKSMSTDVLDFLKGKSIINDTEYKFYSDITSKRKLTDKQKRFKIKINQKLLDFTTEENQKISEKIELVLRWAQNRTDFDTKIVNDYQLYYKKKGYLTEKQRQALDNIIKKWGVN